MGIFGNRKKNDQQYDDQAVEAVTQDAYAPVAQGPIDDVTPVYQDQPVNDQGFDPTNVSAPPVASPISDDAGDYIMADPPTPPANNWDEATHHQHDDIIETNQPEPPTQEIPAEPTGPGLVAEASAEMPSTSQPVGNDLPAQDDPGAPSAHPISVSDGQAPDELAEIREKALRELSPLVAHLEQSPEERFSTAMMMLQATDDHSLVKTAYEAAQTITDEKTKAQALLDIVNEINYFTQK